VWYVADEVLKSLKCCCCCDGAVQLPSSSSSSSSAVVLLCCVINDHCVSSLVHACVPTCKRRRRHTQSLRPSDLHTTQLMPQTTGAAHRGFRTYAHTTIRGPHRLGHRGSRPWVRSSRRTFSSSNKQYEFIKITTFIC